MTTSPASRGLTHLGILLMGGALVSAYVAWLHMRELVLAYGVICGAGSGVMAHCPACFTSASLLATGVISLVLARAVPVPAAAIRARTPQSE